MTKHNATTMLDGGKFFGKIRKETLLEKPKTAILFIVFWILRFAFTLDRSILADKSFVSIQFCYNNERLQIPGKLPIPRTHTHWWLI